MDWFEKHKADVAGPDSTLPGRNYKEIAEIADTAMDADTMTYFIDDKFGTQKAFGEFIGVGESTVTGWIKNGTFPTYARRAVVGAYYAAKHYRETLKAAEDILRPKIVKSGGSYMVVRFSVDEAGIAIGEVIARDIPSEKDARLMAGASRAWELLKRAEELIDEEIEGREGFVPNDLHKTLKSEIGAERGRVFQAEGIRRFERNKPAILEALRQGDHEKARRLSYGVDASDVTAAGEHDE